ncbi:hypothetical protein K402DRAFT_148879 [Aulographum hederae CBS 113979]|uniref:Uncharacterized protein n=1 Tax=Aulographum hederae CBS 113979 TaxID=1176131 RepID=A0A6G1GSS3_9PEZI|nr:hypothetical protein K402DRAFT_148879 [Aulographum hederae CBS 113979]
MRPSASSPSTLLLSITPAGTILLESLHAPARPLSQALQFRTSAPSSFPLASSRYSSFVERKTTQFDHPIPSASPALGRGGAPHISPVSGSCTSRPHPPLRVVGSEAAPRLAGMQGPVYVMSSGLMGMDPAVSCCRRGLSFLSLSRGFRSYALGPVGRLSVPCGKRRNEP